MAYIATIEVLIDVEDEASACDALAETLRDHLQRYEPQSCIIDWAYLEKQAGVFAYPVPATEADIERVLEAA